jgi:PhzF family phenazine biosynthesis protein
LEDWLDEKIMQKIAMENNLSETAYIKKLDNNKYEIRWFSPLSEIDFCGHATLASSYVIFEKFEVKSSIEFVTLKVGSLFVTKKRRWKNRDEFSKSRAYCYI